MNLLHFLFVAAVVASAAADRTTRTRPNHGLGVTHHDADSKSKDVKIDKNRKDADKSAATELGQQPFAPTSLKEKAEKAASFFRPEEWECTDDRGVITGYCADDTYCCIINGYYDCCVNGDDSNSNSGCFSGSDTVLLEDMTAAPISDLKIGDRVVSWTEGKVGVTEVVFLPHPKNDIEATFIRMELASGRSVQMTPNHIIPFGECANPATIVPGRADLLTVGKCVFTVSGVEEVVGLSSVRDRGMYTLVTKDEFVLVNGIVASPFAMNHYVADKFYSIHRFAYDYFPSALTYFSGGVASVTRGVGAWAVTVFGSNF